MIDVSRMKYNECRILLALMLENAPMDMQTLSVRSGVKDKNFFYSAIKALDEMGLIEVRREAGKRSTYSTHLVVSYGGRGVVGMGVTHIDKDIDNNIFISMCNVDAKPSDPAEPAQTTKAFPQPDVEKDPPTYMVEPVRLDHTSMGEPYGLNHTGRVEPYTSSMVEAYTPDTTMVEPYTFDDFDEESLLSRMIDADELPDIQEHGKRSERRKQQIMLVNEAWKQFFPYANTIGESTSLKWLRLFGGYSEYLYNIFDQASKYKPESPVSYVEAVINKTPKPQLHTAINAAPSREDVEREKEYERKQALIDQMTDEEVMTPWLLKSRAAQR